MSASCAGAAASAGGSTGFKVYGSLFKVDARYQFLHALGKGSYGIVCAARDKETGQCVAIKKVSPMAKRTVDAKHTLREVLLLQYLGQHPNIVSVHNLSTNVKDDELYIVMDLMDTDLHRVIQSAQPLSEAHVKFFLHQLLRGVKYLHDHGVLHRDLKPGNLLLTKTCQLKIADFGLARKMPKVRAPPTGGTGVGSVGLGSASERPRSAPAASSCASRTERAPMTEHVVTRWYRAPELMLQPDGLYDCSVDMWSVGCILAEILGRKALFPGKNFMHQLTLIFDVIGTPPAEAAARVKSAQAQKFLRSLGRRPAVPLASLFPSASASALDLLDKLLAFDPARRLSADAALAHPFLADVERKHKGGGDPHPPLRVDFSFDSRNMTKTDLRAMIIQQVDRVRTRQAGGGDGGGGAAPELAAGADARAQPAPRAMCGAAGSSLARAAASAARPSAQCWQPNGLDAGPRPPAPAPAPAPGQPLPLPPSGAVVLGSTRHRIRTLSKPPVPRRPSASASSELSAAWQGSIRVASTAATQQLLAQDSCGQAEGVEADPSEQQAAPGGADANLRADALKSAAVASPTEHAGSPAGPESTDSGGGQDEASRPRSEPATAPRPFAASASPAESSRAARAPPCAAATGSRPAAWERTTAWPPAAVTAAVAPPALEARSSATSAIAAAIALAERSKALIASLAASAAVSPAARRREADAPPSRPPESPSLSSSASSSPASGPGSPPCSREPAPATRRFSLPAEPTIPRRRATSAGPLRPRASGASAPSDGTFVGSTRSLIRAQRAGSGQSLTESADRALAAMAAAASAPVPATATTSGTAAASGREEDERASPPREGEGLALRPQRSSSQLPIAGGEPPVAGGRKAAAKRLTVPRSPKFSVMSWQKKKDAAAAAAATAAAAASRR